MTIAGVPDSDERIPAVVPGPREPGPLILLVDDEAINRTTLAALLGPGYETAEAADGLAALEVCRRFQPDLVLLDVEMPGLSGFEVCRLLKADPDTRHVSVVFVTGHSTEEDEERGLGVGAIDFLSKATSAAIVRVRVQNHVALKRQRDSLEVLSLRDALTNVGNRRAYDEVLKREYRRAARAHRSLGLLLIDVDFFKAFNDTQGHLAGDGCLRRIGQVIAENARRAGDFAARCGGEEFAIIATDTEIAGLTFIAERTLWAVRDLAIPHGASRVAKVVTISIGGAVPVPVVGIPAERLVAEADARLYRAKDGGRARAIVESISLE